MSDRDHEKLREAIAKVRKFHLMASNESSISLVLAAAESTLPKTKMVEVWHVEYALHSRCPAIYLFTSKEQAKKQAEFMQENGMKEGWRCIRVTGPHLQEVPA